MSNPNNSNGQKLTLDKKVDTKPETVDFGETAIRMMEALECIAETLERFAMQGKLLDPKDALYVIDEPDVQPL